MADQRAVFGESTSKQGGEEAGERGQAETNECAEDKRTKLEKHKHIYAALDAEETISQSP
jgi:hypothetical protein